MTHEAGIWIFCIIALVCLSVWLLCRRSKAVAGRIGKKPYGNPQPFHYEPMTQDEQDAKNKAWSDLAAQMPLLAPVKWIDKDDFAEMYGETSKPLPKGWQGWEGSVLAPVQEGTRIVIMLRNGSIIESCGGWCNWVHHECGGDIVAWRAA